MKVVVGILNDDVRNELAKELLKIGGRIVVGVGIEVAIHFASKAIINKIENELKEEVIILDDDLEEFEDEPGDYE